MNVILFMWEIFIIVYLFLLYFLCEWFYLTPKAAFVINVMAGRIEVHPGVREGLKGKDREENRRRDIDKSFLSS